MFGCLVYLLDAPKSCFPFNESLLASSKKKYYTASQQSGKALRRHIGVRLLYSRPDGARVTSPPCNSNRNNSTRPHVTVPPTSHPPKVASVCAPVLLRFSQQDASYLAYKIHLNDDQVHSRHSKSKQKNFQFKYKLSSSFFKETLTQQ